MTTSESAEDALLPPMMAMQDRSVSPPAQSTSAAAVSAMDKARSSSSTATSRPTLPTAVK